MREDSHFLSMEQFLERLDFLDDSGMDQVRFLGGEPTLNPFFPQMVSATQSAGKKVMVFTNGIMPEASLQCLEILSRDECAIIININDPTETNPIHFQRQCESLRRLGTRCFPGFNIYRPDFDMDFLLPIMREAGCQPVIRVGLAQPCLSGDNRYIHTSQYQWIGKKLTQFARVASKQGIRVDFDCGFVPCMFSDQDLSDLQNMGVGLGWYCSPILDVDIKGKVIHCFPLAQLGEWDLIDFDCADDLRSSIENTVHVYRNSGIYPSCVNCEYKSSGICTGGCLSHVIRRFRILPAKTTIPISSCGA